MKNEKKIFYSVAGLIITMLVLFLMLSIILAFHMETYGESVASITLLVASLIVFIIGCGIAVNIEVNIGKNKCAKCGHEFQPKFKNALLAPHAGFTRYLKCPKCNKKSWCKKIIEK